MKTDVLMNSEGGSLGGVMDLGFGEGVVGELGGSAWVCKDGDGRCG